jgi:hypothetical protein
VAGSYVGSGLDGLDGGDSLANLHLVANLRELEPEQESESRCMYRGFGGIFAAPPARSMGHHKHMLVRYLRLSWTAVHSSISVASAIRRCGRLLAAKHGASGTLLWKHVCNPLKLTST